MQVSNANEVATVPGGGAVVDPRELLTPDELAALLKVQKSWIFERTRRRSRDPLPCVRVGRYPRFIWSDVSQWLARHQHGGLERTK